jgi:hypothetical protein
MGPSVNARVLVDLYTGAAQQFASAGFYLTDFGV